ncbi:hypothetical protein JHD94_23125 [Enterobacter roggenkampii]|uniref:hypothetical protein n=1 Tax=Enterobacter roggenkampii TaxID=1812935 RepID=UPI00190B3F93|nr:hypothetical protein [Enterobacter roggenkampii]MBK4126174.1 hypothetical protein [Enterobacter roggenkampii]
MSTITKERVAEFIKNPLNNGLTRGEQMELARIALASLEAEAVCYLTWHQGFRAPDDCEEYVVEAKPGDKSCDGSPAFPVYAAPPAPVSDEDKVLAEQARAVVHCLDMCGVPSGDYADNEQLQLWGRVIEYGRHPASVSVPDGYRLQPISEYDAMCAAMLQGADGNSPVIPDGWVACSDRLPDPDSAFRVCAYTPTPHEDFRFRSVPASLFKSVCRDATHWQYMLPPAAPQQE